MTSERVLIQAVAAESPLESGVGWVVRGTAAAMQARGWRVVGVTGGDIAPGVKGRQYAAVPVAVGLRVRRALEQLPRGTECVVECHSALVGLVPTILAGARARCRTVFRGHGFWRAAVALAAADERDMRTSAWRTWRSELTLGNLERAGVRGADGVVVQSRHDERFVMLVDGVERERVARVPPAVATTTPVLEPVDGPLEVLWVGRPSLVKGSDVLVDVVSTMAARHPSRLRFTIVGLDPATFASSNVTVVPFLHRDELARVYARAGAFLWTSRFEGFGLAPFEAMAHGVPVVSTHVGGLEGVLADGVNGLAVAEVRTDAFCDALTRMLALSLGDRRALRRGAWEAASTFTWDEHGRALDDFYTRLLRG